MKFILYLFSFAIFLCGTVLGEETRPVAKVFEAELADMQSGDANRIKNGQRNWQQLCFEVGALGQESRKDEAIRLMSNALENSELNGTVRFWLIRQLGRIDDGDNAALIGRFFSDPDRRIRDEVVWSLANIPNEKAGAVLEDLLSKETDSDKKPALRNALKYRVGRNQTDLTTLDRIVESLESDDPATWQHSLSKLPWLETADISKTRNYRERFSKLSPLAQTLLIDALAEKRDRTALPLALEMTDSDDERLRNAGYRAIGLLGDASIVPLLLESIREKGDFGNTVRESISRLDFDGADRLLLEAYEFSNDNGVKTDLLAILNRRKGTISIPVFETALNNDDERIREVAIRSLEEIGQQSSVPPLADRYFIEGKKEFREAIEKAIVQIESRYGEEDGRGKTLCDVIKKRNENEQVPLIPLLGRIGGRTAAEFVLDRYENGKPSVREAAFRSLCNWNDASVAGELYRVATSDVDPKSAAAARSYIRIVTLHEHGRSDKDKFAYVEKAMSVAKTDDDRRFLLTRLDPSRCIEVFRFAVGHVDNPELEQAACKAIVDMANDTGFHMKYRAEIEPGLDMVVERSKDGNHVERAKRYKARR